MQQILQYGATNSLAQTVPDVEIVIVPPELLVVGAPSDIQTNVGVGSWGPVNQVMTAGTLAESIASVGPVTNRLYDLSSSVAIGVLQGSNNFRLIRVSDGTDTAATVTVPSAAITASPTFWASLAAAINSGVGILRGASQYVSVDGVAGVVSGLYTGVVGNGIQLKVGPGSKVGSYKGTVLVAGAQAEVYDNLVAATAPTTATYTLTGGTDGASGVTSAQQVGSDVEPPTGMYAARGQGSSVILLVDMVDPAQWTTVDAFAQSESAFAVHQVALGTSISAAIALKAGEGLDSRYSKLMHGDGVYFNDTNLGLIRLASPSSFAAAKIASLNPNQSALNKAVSGIVGSQKSGTAGSGSTGRYSTADLSQLLQAGIDVICNPAPGGAYWAVRGGRNTSSNAAIRQDASTTMNNYIATSLAAIMGVYVGADIDADLLLEITAALNTFGANQLALGLLGTPISGARPYQVVCDASNNPGSLTGIGFLRASFKVQTQAILEDFEIDLEDGPTVSLASNSAS